MNASYFLDTNLLVYAFDQENAEKQTVAKHYLHCLLTDKNYVISLQVVNEFCNVVLRKLTPAMSMPNVRAFLSFIPEDRILPLTKAITLKALELKDRYKFSFWDSMILGTAINAGCTYLLTEDLSHTQQIELVTMINPFLPRNSDLPLV